MQATFLSDEQKTRQFITQKLSQHHPSFQRLAGPSVWVQVEAIIADVKEMGLPTLEAFAQREQYDSIEHFFNTFTPAINGPR